MRLIHKNQKGLTLIEVLIALVILGIVTVALLTALTTSSRALILADEKTTAESLARSQLEYVKNAEYIDYSLGTTDPEREPDVYGVYYEVYTEIDPPTNYSLTVTAVPINPSDDPDPDYGTPSHEPYDETTPGSNIYDRDAGMQLITVEVYHQSKLVLTTEDYKVYR